MVYSHSPWFCLPFTNDLDDRLIGAGVNDLRLKVQIGVHGTMAGGGLVPATIIATDHFIELQPLLLESTPVIAPRKMRLRLPAVVASGLRSEIACFSSLLV